MRAVSERCTAGGARTTALPALQRYRLPTLSRLALSWPLNTSPRESSECPSDARVSAIASPEVSGRACNPQVVSSSCFGHMKCMVCIPPALLCDMEVTLPSSRLRAGTRAVGEILVRDRSIHRVRICGRVVHQLVSPSAIGPGLIHADWHSSGCLSTGRRRQYSSCSCHCPRPRYARVPTASKTVLTCTQGSTWIYQTYLHPYFERYETDIDAGIAAAQTNVLTFLQTRIAALWQFLWDLATRGAPAQGQAQGPATNGARPAPNPMDMAKGLWNAYGPSVIGAFQQASRPAQSRPAPTASSSSFRVNSSPDVHSRASPSGFPGTSTGESLPPSSHSTIPPTFPEPQFY